MLCVFTKSSKLGPATLRFLSSSEELDSSLAAPSKVINETTTKKLVKAKNQK
jgi:hypothetical protein